MHKRSVLITLLLFPTLLIADAVKDGISHFDNGKFKESYQALAPLAAKGDAKAQVYIGVMYYNGQGVKESNKEAFNWFQKAAKQGNAQGQYELAQMYIFGFGVPSNETEPDKKAIDLYTKAANQGHADAQYELGVLYITGKGVESSEEKGMAWIKKAAKQGHTRAREFAGDT